MPSVNIRESSIEEIAFPFVEHSGPLHDHTCFSSSIPITYYLIHDEYSSSASPLPFALDTHTGTITVIAELDREVKSFYHLQIYLFNTKTLQITPAEVHINVLDENDHYPVFDHFHEQVIYINISSNHSRFPYSHPSNQIFITHVHAADADIDINGQVVYYFTNHGHYDYFQIYPNGSIMLYNTEQLQLPYCLEISARDRGYPKSLAAKETMVIYLCDFFKRNECPSNRLRIDFYLGSIFILVSVILFLLVLIICIVWHLFVKELLQADQGLPGSLYQCPTEARRSLSNRM